MTYYELTQLAERNCGHGKNTVCVCDRKPLSKAVSDYLKRKRSMYPSSATYNAEWTPEGRRDERFRCVENAASGLRFIGKVHEIKMGEATGDNRPYIESPLIEHSGWYDTFKDGSGLCYGVVYQLPTRRRGEWQYVPGYDNGGYDEGSPTLDFHSITSDIRQAIRYADKMAESAAEEERAYQAKDRAETRVAEINGEVGDIRRTMHGLFSEIKANRDNAGGAPHLREAVCSQVKAHRSRIKKLIREKLRLEADFWNALPEDCRY